MRDAGINSEHERVCESVYDRHTQRHRKTDRQTDKKYRYRERERAREKETKSKPEREIGERKHWTNDMLLVTGDSRLHHRVPSLIFSPSVNYGYPETTLEIILYIYLGHRMLICGTEKKLPVAKK